MDIGQIATLVRAVARLRRGTADDQALLDALARLIEPAPAVVTKAPVGASDRAAADREPVGVVPGGVAARPDPQAAPPGADTDAPAPQPRERKPADGRLVAEPTVLERLAERADLVVPERPAAQVDSEPRPAGADAGGAAAPLESLFAPGRVRGIVREMTTLSRPSGSLDIATIVRHVARALPVTRLPRLKVTTLGHTVQWLFDAGTSMLPFARDKQQLAATATRLLGRDRVRIADFIGHPSQAVRVQRQVQWGGLHWPPRGSALVVVSDLGIGSGDAALLAPQWQEFLDVARRQRLRSVVLIPYSHDRWPAVAAAFDTALTWDLATGVQGLRRERRLARRH